ncbi:MAG: Dyp-type peroxidase [Pasteurellaceae bacterium]|nr:Dyp-type peroxidase [Pasteurellaceae bacterium]
MQDKPQSQAVIDEPNENTIFMVWQFKDGIDIQPTFKKLCGLMANINNSAANRYPTAQASCVMGIGYNAWLCLDLPQPLPKELTNFRAIKGDKHVAVSTPADLHFHIRASEKSIVYDISAILTDTLIDVADCTEEIHGFRYWDGRSILGFVDGTENPHSAEEREFFSVIGDNDPNYRGGSYLFVQKYVHNMQAWRKLPVDEQEKIIGRSKQDDIEMDDDTKPTNSHIALANVGDDFKVVRDNMPFGNAGTNEMGTYFIAYASTFKTVNKMLSNMFIGVPKGNYDRILDFSRAETGSLFFVPSLDMLDQFAE